MTLKECFDTRKLRKIPPSRAKAQASLVVAAEKLKEARGLAEAGFGNAALLAAYASMFHSSRSLLFRDGVQEKSHYCLVEYLKENYVKTNKLGSESVTLMDAFREERHDVLYSLHNLKVKKEEVLEAVETAGKMLKEIKSLLGA